jgi:hypothetical protein
MGQWCPKHVKALNPNESESESKVCIKLVVFITLHWTFVMNYYNILSSYMLGFYNISNDY